jgi:hypothetical protein
MGSNFVNIMVQFTESLPSLKGTNAPSMINDNYKEEKGVILIQTIWSRFIAQFFQLAFEGELSFLLSFVY